VGVAYCGRRASSASRAVGAQRIGCFDLGVEAAPGGFCLGRSQIEKGQAGRLPGLP
jgi:hypothetical protein